MAGGRGEEERAIEFTKGGTALLVWSDGLRNALGESERRATLKYTLSGTTLRLEEPGDRQYRQRQEMRIEVVSADEMILVVEKRAMSFDWLEGKVQRAK
jgi:sulfur transfer complex TusBCD TusB component (DsrH family)